MLFSEEQFYTEFLDLSVPELRAARDAELRGERDEAAALFTGYLKKSLRTDRYFLLPDYPRENSFFTPGETDLEIADRVTEGKLMACGVMHDFGDRVDFTYNPTYNGYKEWTYQLSRHHEFRILGKAYRATKDEKYAACFVRLVREWIAEAPCPGMISGYATLLWRTIEAGIRMSKNWHYAIHAFLASPGVTDADWVLIFRSVYEHAYRLRFAATANNWLIMEMSGLCHIGVLYPFFRDSAAWTAEAKRRLEEELSHQLYPDGIHFELSTGYQGAVIDNYEFVLDLLHCYGEPVSPSLLAKFHDLYAIYPKLCRPTWDLPDLNDGKNESVAQRTSSALRYFPDDARYRYFATGGREGVAPEEKSMLLPYAGFAVFRTGYGKNDLYALFDGGPFGKAHQHEDKLNFILTAYGVHMLDDPGNFYYDNSQMRKYVLTTCSHNTGTVDNLPQNRRKNYTWHPEDIGKRSRLRMRIGENTEVAEAVYNEGYGENLLPVSHTRRVVFFKKGLGKAKPFFLLLDSFRSGDGRPHHCEISFQLDAEPVRKDGQTVLRHFSGGQTLALVGTVEPSVHIGETNPYRGWKKDLTPGEHEHRKAPLVAFEKQGEFCHFATVVYPSPNTRVRNFGVERTAFGVKITVDDETFAFAMTDEELSV